jgi:hypothetical protein
MSTLAHTQTAGVNAKRVTIGSVCKVAAAAAIVVVFRRATSHAVCAPWPWRWRSFGGLVTSDGSVLSFPLRPRVTVDAATLRGVR